MSNMPELAIATTPAAEAAVLEMTGRWWLATAPHHHVGGTLRLGVSEGTLELAGELADANLGGSLTVLGISNVGEAISIPAASLSSTHTSSSRDLGEPSIAQTLVFVRLLRGAHFGDGDAQRFEVISFTTPAIAAWMQQRPFKIEHEPDGARTIRLATPEPVPIRLPNGTLTLQWSESGSFGLNVLLRLVPTFVWCPIEPTTLDAALSSIAQPIEFLMTLAIGQIVKLDDVKVSTVHVRDEVWRTAKLALARGIESAGAIEDRSWEHLIPYRTVEADLPTVLSTWIDLATRHRSAMVQFFAGALSTNAYLEEAFLSAVRALEIWHRGAFGGEVMSEDDFSALLNSVRQAVSVDDWNFLRARLQHANEPSLKQRLDAMISVAAEPLANLIGQFHKFTRRVVDTRNVFTHVGTEEECPFDDLELFYAHKACAALFAETVLQAAGLRHVVVERLPHTGDWRWLSSEGNPFLDWNAAKSGP